MIKTEILKRTLELQTKVKEGKLYLAQKDLVEYTNWKAKEENAKSRDAMDKVVSRLKLEDSGDWLMKEEQQVWDELELKKYTMVLDILRDMLKLIGQDGVTRDYFEEVQESYMTEVLGE